MQQQQLLQEADVARSPSRLTQWGSKSVEAVQVDIYLRMDHMNVAKSGTREPELGVPPPTAVSHMVLKVVESF